MFAQVLNRIERDATGGATPGGQSSRAGLAWDQTYPERVLRHAEKVVQEFLTTPEGLELAEVFPRIGRGRVRRQVLDLVRAMADEAAREA